ncbi:MAG: hypothetical protein ACK44B_11970, partial [Flavobacteriales bacterium]
ACTKNTVEAYEEFLVNYPKSLHNKDAHIRLVDAAEKRAIDSQKIDQMTQYIMNYLITNDAFLGADKRNSKKKNITQAIENQLIKECIKNDPKNTYTEYSTLWKRYVLLADDRSINTNFTEFSRIGEYQIKIYDVLFNRLKEANTPEKQSAWKVKTLSDFPTLEDKSKKINGNQADVFYAVLEGQKKGTGLVKLYNITYIRQLMRDNSAFKEIKSDYTYKGYSNSSMYSITAEEFTFSNGKIEGPVKVYNGQLLEFSAVIGPNYKPKDISYYQAGKLVKTTYFKNLDAEKEEIFEMRGLKKYYSYEFENGVNLSLKELDQKIKEGNALVKQQRYDEAISYFREARNNDFPSSVSQNSQLDKLITSTQNQLDQVAKKNEEERIAKEKELKKPIYLEDFYDLIDNPTKYFGRTIAFVGYPSSSNEFVFHQHERSKVYPDGYYRNESFKNTQFYDYSMASRVREEKINWKKVVEIETSKSLTINIPNKFFDQKLIPEATGNSLYVFYIEVYPMT